MLLNTADEGSCSACSHDTGDNALVDVFDRVNIEHDVRHVLPCAAVSALVEFLKYFFICSCFFLFFLGFFVNLNSEFDNSGDFLITNKLQPDLAQSVCATNLALGMTNQMGNRAGEFFQNGPEGLFPPFSKDPFMTLTTAEVYFQLGLVNTAQRYYFEAMEAAPNYKKSCRCIRRLAETNLINGQYNVARKYLHNMEKTLFYKKWAQRTLSMIDEGEKSIMQHPLYGRLRRMILKDDFLYSNHEIDKICGRLLMQNKENVLAMQYMLLYPLLENNYEKFIQYMHLVKDEVPYSQEFASFEKYLRIQSNWSK